MGDQCTGRGSVEEGLVGQAGLALEVELHPGDGWEFGGPGPRPRLQQCCHPPLLMLFSSALTVAALVPPNALASLCLRSLARRGLPSLKPTSPWSLLPPCLHSLVRAASGHTPTPLPGTAVARQPGVRYPTPLGPGGQGRRERGPAGDQVIVPIPVLIFPQLSFYWPSVRLWDKQRDG